MDAGFRRRVKAAWSHLPDGMRSAPASAAQIASFESRFGRIPSDFRWFLEECGGGVVGSEWVDNIEKLSDTHEKFFAESGVPSGWTMKGVFVIGWDGAGNPFGIDSANGKLMVDDHNSGGAYEIAPSFEVFLARGLQV